MMFFYTALALIFCLTATAESHIYDFSRNYYKDKDALEVFLLLAQKMPHLLGLLDQPSVVMVFPNSLHKPLDAVGKEAYRKEAERVLLSYAAAYKRKYPEKMLEIILEDSGTYKRVSFDNNAPLGFQNYYLEEVSRDRTVRSQEVFFDLEQSMREKKLIVPHFEQNSARNCIVITGCAGLLGSILTKVLLDQGFDVIGLDNEICGNKNNLLEILESPHFYYVKHDITQPFDIVYPIKAVVHLASIPSPAMYYINPLETLEVGIKGTLHTLDLAVAQKARYLFASTSEVYGNPEVHPQPESYWGNVDPLGIRSPYDESKRGAETLIALYGEKYALDVRIARIFNTYGPGMRLSDGRVITNFIEALIKDNPLTIYGTGEQTRSFAYVTDTVDGLVRLLKNETLCSVTALQDRIFNIGNPTEFTIQQLAEILGELWYEKYGKKASLIKVPNFDSTDPRVRCPDIKKAEEILGYKPSVSLKEGLSSMLSYYAA